jgi:hypothetical protein
MVRVLAAPGAKLGELQLVLLLSLVLGCGVIALPANGALQGNNGSIAFGHDVSLLFDCDK